MTRVCVRGADATEEERRWATCMLLSRACAAPTAEHRGEHPSVLMPFLDLLNHGESCRHETEGGSAVIVASSTYTERSNTPGGTWVLRSGVSGFLTNHALAREMVWYQLTLDTDPNESAACT